MKPKLIDLAIRLLAIPVGLMGLYIIALSLHAFYQEVTSDIPWTDWQYILLTLFIGLLMGSIVFGLCGFAIYTAVGTWKKITTTRVRWLLAFYALALWGLIMSMLRYAPIEVDDMTRLINEHSISSVLIIVCAIVYQITSRWLIARSSLGPEPPRPAARNWVGAFCILIWVGLSGVIGAWSQAQPRPRGGPNSWLEALSYLGPMLFAWLLYKSIIYFQDRRFKRYELSRRGDPLAVHI